MTNFIFKMASLLPDRQRVWIARSAIGAALRLIATSRNGREEVVEIAAGPVHGLRIVTDLSVNRAYVVGTYEPENVAAIMQVCQPGMTAVDIGAHEGYMTLIMAKLVGATGSVLACEPLPQNFQRLSQTMAMNDLRQVALYQMALSDGRNFRARFETSPQSSSMGRLVEDEPPSSASFEVDVSSLDRMIQNLALSRVDFVKVDVEGHDLEVLNGMQWVIERFGPTILIEFHSDNLLESGRSFLTERGYQLNTINAKVRGVLATKQLPQV